MNVASFLAHISADWVIVAAVFAIAFLDTLRAGAVRAIALALAFPLAKLFLGIAPSAALIGGAVGSLGSSAPAVLFLAVVALCFVLLRRMIGLYGDFGPGSLASAIAALAISAIVLVFWTATPALDSLWHFGASVRSLLAPAYQLWIFVVAYTALAFVRS